MANVTGLTENKSRSMHDNGKIRGNGNAKQEPLIGNLPVPQLRHLREFPDRTSLKEDRLQAIIKMLLLEIGLDVNSEHFRDTPKRVARFYRESTRGYHVHPAEILKTFASRNGGLIVLSNIDFFSLCPHHLLIYGGRIHFGYVPDGRIAGISKIPRLIHALAERAVVQEELVADIADAFMSVVKPLGCAVKAIGRHDCVAARGVRCPEATMTTVVLRGIFSKDQNYAEEFYQGIARNADCVR
jgi:GTP cyclohydrolase I